MVPSEVRFGSSMRSAFPGNLNRNRMDVATAQFAKAHFHNMVEQRVVVRNIKKAGAWHPLVTCGGGRQDNLRLPGRRVELDKVVVVVCG